MEGTVATVAAAGKARAEMEEAWTAVAARAAA